MTMTGLRLRYASRKASSERLASLSLLERPETATSLRAAVVVCRILLIWASSVSEKPALTPVVLWTARSIMLLMLLAHKNIGRYPTAPPSRLMVAASPPASTMGLQSMTSTF